MGSSPLYYTFIVFGVIMALIYYTKPNMMFDKNKIKSFGIGKNKSLTPLPVMALIIAILLYSIFFYIDSINAATENAKYINDTQNHIHPQIIHHPQMSYSQMNQPQMSHQPMSYNNINPAYTYRLVRTAPDGSLII